LHQFFSLHRPLLLLGNPPAIFQTAPNGIALGAPPPPPEPAHAKNGLEGIFNPFIDTTPDADAETARQLSRSITMSKVGGQNDWETALRRLGLNLEQTLEHKETKIQMEKDWTDVVMDSTKRKRRKKMKKHKYVFFIHLWIHILTALSSTPRLKKRRRLTRSTRLRLR
jgi:hypothetical protein